MLTATSMLPMILLLADPVDTQTRDHRLGVGLSAGGASGLFVGGGLMGLSGTVDSLSPTGQKAMFGTGGATAVLAMGSLATGMAFIGRRNAAPDGTRSTKGIAWGSTYLAISALGTGLAIAGAHGLAFGPEDSRRRGLSLAGVIAGGNIAFFTSLAGGYFLGVSTYEGAPTSGTTPRTFGLSWSGRF